MNANEPMAHTLLAELRRFAGDTPTTARIVPMQWVAIVKEIGLSDKARNEAVAYLREKGYIRFQPETTEIIAFTPAGIELADSQIKKTPKLSDPFPKTLDGICAELDYWEAHLNDGDPGSIYWDQVQARIEGLRHRENRYRPSNSLTFNAIGANVRINQNSVDQSTNLVSAAGEGSPSQSEDFQATPVADYAGEVVSLRNFHVDSNLKNSDMLRRSDGFFKNLVASFRQSAANGHFTFGPVKLQDADLNRVHGIVSATGRGEQDPEKTDDESRRVIFKIRIKAHEMEALNRKVMQ
jgi:hypothetical protein